MKNILIIKNINKLYGFDLDENFFEINNCSLIIKDGRYYKLIVKNKNNYNYIISNFKFSENFISFFENSNEKEIIIKDYNLNEFNFYEIDSSSFSVAPTFVDPHTHAIFNGYRENEFFLRNSGTSYLEIAKRGGGIGYSVKMTREASDELLLKNLLIRLERFAKFGISHIEIKSGYGLTKNDEIRLLQVIKKAKNYTNISIYPTCLAAHDYPPELKNEDYTKRSSWVDIILNEIIPEVKEKNLAIFFDIFSEEKVFNLKDTEKILYKAKDYGFKLKAHTDELSNIGATELAVSLGATSVDHLLKISDNGINALKNSNTIPVLLPGTAFYLNEPYAPYDKFKSNSIDIAIGSDFNPGTNCTENIQLIYTIAAIKLKMNLKELLKSSTITASKALAIDKNNIVGIIDKNRDANLNIFDSPNLEHIYYHWGINHIKKTLIKGTEVYVNLSNNNN